MPASTLRRTLVLRLAVLEFALLLVLLLVITAVQWRAGVLVVLEGEDEIIEAAAAAVGRDAAGRMVLRNTPALARLRNDVPDLWLILRDRAGEELSIGPVPPVYEGIAAALSNIGQARLGWNIGDDARPPARMKWTDSAIGEVQIMTGPGGPVPLRRMVWYAMLGFAGILLPVFAVMLAATLVATPFVVRASLRGLNDVAQRAGDIDPDRRGTRLPLDGVPGEIVPLVAAVNDALQRLDEGLERRQRFLADAAHELRTPIAILSTRLDALPAGPQRQVLMDDLARLALLAEQLLDLERLDRGQSTFARLDLVALLRRVIAELAPLAIAANRLIEFDCAERRVEIIGDVPALERVIANLVQNALAHVDRGAITVRLEAGASIEVCDEGGGIPPEARERIFEPFQRLRTNSKGTGLGLHLVARIVRAHGGSISVVDMPGGGGCFRIDLPQVAR